MSSLRKSRSQKLSDSPYSSKSSVAPANDSVPPDIVYKISKKVAQLTKVIYYLNTKNEDHAVEIQSLAEAYEDEIQDVILDGRKRINVIREELDDSLKSINDKNDKLQTYQQKHKSQEAELEAFRLRAATLQHTLQVAEGEKTEALQRHQQDLRLMEELTGERDRLVQELEASRTTLEERLRERTSEYEANLQEIKRRSLHASQELRETYDKDKELLHGERARLQNQLEEAVSAANEEQGEKLQSCLEEIQQLEKKLRTKEDEYGRQAEALEQRLTAKYEEEHSRFLQCESAKEELNAALERKSEQLLKLQKEMEDATSSLRQSEKSVNERNNMNKMQNEQNLELRRKIHTLEEQIKALDAIALQRAEELQTGSDALNKAYSQHSVLQNQFEKVSEVLKDAEVKIRALEQERDLCQADASDKESIRVGLEKLLVDEALKSKQVLESSLAQLRMELQKRNAKDLESAATEHKSTLADIVSQKDKELQALKVQALNERSDAAAREKVLVASEQSLMVGSKYVPVCEEAIIAYYHYLKQQIREYQHDNNELEARLKDTADKLNEQIREDVKKTETIQQLKETARNLEIDKADLFQQMVHLDEEIRQEMQTRFDKEKTDILQTRILKLVLQSLLTNRERQYEEQVQAIRITQQKEMAKMQRMITAAEENLGMQKGEMEMATLEKDAMMKAHRAAMVQQAEVNRRALEEAKTQWDAESHSRETQLKIASAVALANLQKKNVAEKQELEDAHQQQLDNLRTFHTKSNLAAKTEAEQQGLAALEKLRTDSDLRYSELDTRLRSEMAATLSDLEARSNAEFAHLIQTHEAALDEKTQIIKELQDQITSLQSRQEDSMGIIRAREETISDLKESVEEKAEQMSSMREDLVLRIEALKAQLQQEYKEAMDETNAQHVEEVQHMLREFDEAQTYLKRQITSQAKRLQDADTKYINREPRDVDLKQIEELEGHLEQGKQIMSALMEELEHYKRELNNREANFNKIFNKTPIVGMMQTMPPKVKSAKSLTSISSAKLPPLPLTLPATPH
ncbi:hypothetical protein PhCBS80983_g02046 [Powellomyces hirtus]|uniref:Protein FAM184A/B N-terminal domain-containing protein n=1 Tax=Powellomyces hirtus TaxID=109895 RepID=A0A507E9G7_9FUNG|nr:hypothetical protein PhCBS80983_g02046 [Powellomyces hirtus]